MGDPSRPGPQFLARSAGEGEGGRFPAPQPRIVGFVAPFVAGALFRNLGARTKCCRDTYGAGSSAFSCNIKTALYLLQRRFSSPAPYRAPPHILPPPTSRHC